MGMALPRLPSLLDSEFEDEPVEIEGFDFTGSAFEDTSVSVPAPSKKTRSRRRRKVRGRWVLDVAPTALLCLWALHHNAPWYRVRCPKSRGIFASWMTRTFTRRLKASRGHPRLCGLTLCTSSC